MKPRLHNTAGCQTRYTAGCQTWLYNQFDNRLYTRYNRLSNRFDNRFDNWFDNRLYRVNGALVITARGIAKQTNTPAGYERAR